MAIVDSTPGEEDLVQPRWWEYSNATEARALARQKLAQAASVISPLIGSGDYQGARDVAQGAFRPAGAPTPAEDNGFLSKVRQAVQAKWGEAQANQKGEAFRTLRNQDVPPPAPEGDTSAFDIRHPIKAIKQLAENVPEAGAAALDTAMTLTHPLSYNRKGPATEMGLKTLAANSSGQQALNDLGFDTSWLDRLRQKGFFGGLAADTIDVAAAPATIASLGFGGEGGSLASTLARRAGENVGIGLAGYEGQKATQQGLQAYGETNLPGADIAASPITQTVANIIAPIVFGMAAYKGADAIDQAAHPFDANQAVKDIRELDGRMAGASAMGDVQLAGELQDQRNAIFDYLLAPPEEKPNIAQRLAERFANKVLQPRTASLTETLPEGTPLAHGTAVDYPGVPTKPTGEFINDGRSRQRSSIGSGVYYFEGQDAGVNASDWATNRALRADVGPTGDITRGEPVGARVIPAEAARDLNVLNLDAPLTHDEALRLIDATPNLTPEAKASLERMAAAIEAGKTWTGINWLNSTREIAKTDPNFAAAGWDGAILSRAAGPGRALTLADPSAARSPWERVRDAIAAKYGPTMGITNRVPEGTQVYHGKNDGGLEGALRPSEDGLLGPAFYTGSEPRAANAYATGPGGNVTPLVTSRETKLLDPRARLTAAEMKSLDAAARKWFPDDPNPLSGLTGFGGGRPNGEEVAQYLMSNLGDPRMVENGPQLVRNVLHDAGWDGVGSIAPNPGEMSLTGRIQGWMNPDETLRSPWQADLTANTDATSEAFARAYDGATPAESAPPVYSAERAGFGPRPAARTKVDEAVDSLIAENITSEGDRPRLRDIQGSELPALLDEANRRSGNPTGVQYTASGVTPRLGVDDMRYALEAGMQHANWYPTFAQWLVDNSNGRLDEVLTLFAITSQQSPPDNNMIKTFRAMSAVYDSTEGLTQPLTFEALKARTGAGAEGFSVAGKKNLVQSGNITDSQIHKIVDAYNKGLAEATTRGKSKTPSYYQNLRDAYFNRYSPFVTTDTHHSAYFGLQDFEKAAKGGPVVYDVGAGGAQLTDLQYAFVDRLTQQIASEYGIDPSQAQAAMWDTMKKVKEADGGKIAAAFNKGDITWQQAVDMAQAHPSTGSFQEAFKGPEVQAAYQEMKATLDRWKDVAPQDMQLAFHNPKVTAASAGNEINHDIASLLRADVEQRSPAITVATVKGTQEGRVLVGDMRVEQAQVMKRLGLDATGHFPKLDQLGISYVYIPETAGTWNNAIEPNFKLVLPGANDQKVEYVASLFHRQLDSIGLPQDAIAVELPGSKVVTNAGLSLPHPGGGVWTDPELDALHTTLVNKEHMVGWTLSADKTELHFNQYKGYDPRTPQEFSDAVMTAVTDAGYDPAKMGVRTGDSYLLERSDGQLVFSTRQPFFDPTGLTLDSHPLDFREGVPGVGQGAQGGSVTGGGEASLAGGLGGSQHPVQDFLFSPVGARALSGTAGAVVGAALPADSNGDRWQNAARWAARFAVGGDLMARGGGLAFARNVARQEMFSQLKANAAGGRVVSGNGGTPRVISDVGDQGVQDAIARKKEALVLPGPVVQKLPPVLRNGVGIINPAATMDQEVLVAWRARGGTRASLNSTMHATMEPYVAAVEQAMEAHPPAYLGRQSLTSSSLIGTVKDVAERPEAYQIHPQLRQALDAYGNAAWDNVANVVREQYGVDVLPFSANGKSDFVFLPNVPTKASIEEQLAAAMNDPRAISPNVGNPAERMSRSRGTKERAYDTAWDRMQKDPTFQPVTDLRELSTIHIQAMAQNAADNVLKEGLGGLSRAELVEQLHPGLVGERVATNQLVNSLAGRLATVERRVKAYETAAARHETQLRAQANRFSGAANIATNRQADFVARADAATQAYATARGGLADARMALQQAATEKGADQVIARQKAGKLRSLQAKAAKLDAQFAQMMDTVEQKRAAAIDPAQRTTDWLMGDMNRAKGLWKEAQDLQREAARVTRQKLNLRLDPAQQAADEALAARVSSALDTADARQGLRKTEAEAITAAKRAGASGQDVVLGRMQGRLDEMTKRLTDLGRRVAGNQEAADALEPLHKGLSQALADARNRKLELDKAYRTAGTGGYVFDSTTSRYYPPEQANALRYLTAQPTGSLKTLIDLGDEIRATHLAGDFSPITIQYFLGVLADPITGLKATRTMLGQLTRGESPIAALNRLARDEASDVEQYVFHTGRPFGHQEADLSVVVGGRKRGLGRVPGMAAAENQLFGAVQLLMYQQWKADRNYLLGTGMSPNLAAAEAANHLSKVVPSLATSERAVSGVRAGLERATFTSVSFAASPALLLKDATSGLVRLGYGLGAHPGTAWSNLAGREKLAIRRLSTMGATIGGIAAVSAMASAPSRNMSPIEALKQTWDPNSRYFMALQFGDGRSIPLGGPMRGFLKAMYPDHNGVIFGNLPNWLMSRVNTPRTAIDLVRNQDFYGDPIYDGNVVRPENIARALWYGADQVAPMSIGAVGEGIRTGQSAYDTAVDAATQFMGTNYTPVSPNEKLDQIARSTTFTDSAGQEQQGTSSFWDLPPSVQDQVKKAHQDLWNQSVAQGSDNRQKAEQARTEASANQKLDDEALLSGTLSLKDWYDGMGKRKDQLSGQLRGIYMGSGDAPPASTADRKLLEDYYAQIDAATTGDRVDWTKVDTWRAGLNKSQQAYLDANDSIPLSPLLALRSKMLDEYMAIPHYRQMPPDVGNAVDRVVGLVKGGDDVQQLKKLNALVHQGVVSEEHADYARKVILGLWEPTNARASWSKQHPEAALFNSTGGALDPKLQDYLRGKLK